MEDQIVTKGSIKIGIFLWLTRVAALVLLIAVTFEPEDNSWRGLMVFAALGFAIIDLIGAPLLVYGKTLKINKNGCEVIMLKHRYFYEWNELKTIRYERYKHHPNEPNNIPGMRDCYEGILFSRHALGKRRASHYLSSHPFTTFNVNFYSLSKEQDWKLYPVDKEEFMAHMTLWGVHIENLPPS